MASDWQAVLGSIGFRPHGGYGGMRAVVEDVEFQAIDHPWKGLCIAVSHFGARSATSYETFLPRTSDAQTVAALMAREFERIHPERRTQP